MEAHEDTKQAIRESLVVRRNPAVTLNGIGKPFSITGLQL
jgi:hypothetical protein